MASKIAFLVLAVCAAARAQSSSGYLFFAPGGVSNSGPTEATYHGGGGVDAHLVKGLGLNLELGILGPKEYFSDFVGVFSAGGTYYLLRGKEHRVEPFVAGGYTLVFREGHANLGYFGGGVNVWPLRRVGMRLEFRDHLYSHDPMVHFWGFRMGVAFR